MLTWSTTRSDGTGTLSHALAIAIYDYQRAFGREPVKIIIPYFRTEEMDAPLLKEWHAKKNSTFRGIPFRFTIVSDVIELLGREEP